MHAADVVRDSTRVIDALDYTKQQAVGPSE